MKEKQPLVSIIMPVYGVELYIEKAILSVINQTYLNWELLIINDGSKDNSRDIAEKYSTQYENIFLYDKENGGLSDARNFGLKYAKGTYVHFFDSDDWIDEDMYSYYIPIIEKEYAEVLIFGYVVDYVTASGEIIKSTRNKLLDCSYSSENGYNSSLLLQNEKGLSFAWNKIFRCDFLKNNQLFYDPSIYLIEDIEFASRCLPLAQKIVFSSREYYHYASRKRETLSSFYNQYFWDFCCQRPLLYKKLYDGLCISNQDYKSNIDLICIKTFYEAFHALFTHTDMSWSFYYSEVKRFTKNIELRSILETSQYISLRNKVFKYLIKFRFNLLITLLFFIKYTKLIYKK